MSRPYSPRQVLRHLPAGLLRRYFEAEHIAPAVDWAAAAGDPDAVYAAWLDLPPGHRERAEAMLRWVHDLADPAAARMLAEEAAFQGHAPPDLPADHGLHATALAYLTGLGPVFHVVRQVRDADARSGRHWHRTGGLPRRPPDLSPAAVQELKRALGDYFLREQGRGQQVTVEHHPRPGGQTYVFGYPDDYTVTQVGHDPLGTLRRTPVRPAFELVFVSDPAAGTLDTYAPGPRAVRAVLQDLYCQALLGTVPPVERPHDPAYELDRLVLAPGPFPTDPADAVREVRVRRLRVALPGTRRRATLEGDPAAGPADALAFLDEAFPPAAYPRDRLHVTQATLSLTYRPAGAARDRVLTFDLTYPDGCSLKNRPDDQRELGERYLRRWGILRG